MENGSTSKDSIALDWDELYDYMRLFDMSENRTRFSSQPYVVPERLMITFSAKSGRRFQEIFMKKGTSNDSHRKHIEKLNYLQYMNSPQYNQKLFAAIPVMENNMMLYLLYPSSDSINESIKSIGKRLTAEIDEKAKFIGTGNPQLIQKRVNELKEIFYDAFPDYYMEFTPYGSVVSGLCFSKNLLNINIEMDSPDMERLFDRRENPFVNDHYEPHCFNTMKERFEALGFTKVKFDESIDATRFKASEANGIEYSFNKKAITKSTHLIAKYRTLDSRVDPFLKTLKYFCRGRNILAPVLTGGIRFYGYTIMALAYLSSLDPPVIPNLHHINPRSTDDDCNVGSCSSQGRYWDTVLYQNREVGIAARFHNCVEYDISKPYCETRPLFDEKTCRFYWRSSNTSEVGELFIDFLYYYGYKFDYELYAVSLKAGGLTRQKDNGQGHVVVVEDPFIPSINLASSVVDLHKFRGTLRGAFTLLYGGISFEQVITKTPDIYRYDDKRGCDGLLPAYLSYGRLHPEATSIAVVLIGLPKIPEEQQQIVCYCDKLRDKFASYGIVSNLTDLDYNTKKMVITDLTHGANNIALPTSFILDNKRVFIVELYSFKYY